MNNEQRLLEDYVASRITLNTFQNKLNDKIQSVNRNQDAKQERLLKKLSENYVYAKSPEDILIEKERLENIVKILERLQEALPKTLWDIVVQITVYNKTQKEIAKSLNISQSAISQKLKRIVVLASRKISINEYNECFIKPSLFEADTPVIKLKYPSDFVAKTPCQINEYLDNSFNDYKTICSGYCGRICTNKIMKGRINK